MEEHPVAQLVRGTCVALRREDTDALSEFVTEDVFLMLRGTSLVAGIYRGKDGVAEYHRRRRELSGGTYRSTIHDIIANHRHAVAIERSIAGRNGRLLDVHDAVLFHVRDGKVSMILVHLFDLYRHDEFWS